MLYGWNTRPELNALPGSETNRLPNFRLVGHLALGPGRVAGAARLAP